jgi:hypothetical protein
MLKIKTDSEWLAQLQPDFANQVAQLMAAIKRRGFDVKIIQGMRTFAQQDALFAQGRSAAGDKVTKARGGQSFHNYGIAVDFCMRNPVGGSYFPDPHPVWNVIGEEAEKMGLTWGGRWKTPDRPHVEVKMPLNKIQSLYQTGGMAKVWETVAALYQPKAAPAVADLDKSSRALDT